MPNNFALLQQGTANKNGGLLARRCAHEIDYAFVMKFSAAVASAPAAGADMKAARTSMRRRIGEIVPASAIGSAMLSWPAAASDLDDIGICRLINRRQWHGIGNARTRDGTHQKRCGNEYLHVRLPVIRRKCSGGY
jgi:hypothetical protein